ncbi:tail sheath protein [Pantoea ananatis LMG 5342]|nr:tail sheath protein [Pantoea ananatis LMG 5342]
MVQLEPKLKVWEVMSETVNCNEVIRRAINSSVND